MKKAKTVPVLIADEAARRVARLGAERHFEMMLEWTRENVRNLKAIVVVPQISDLSVHENTVFIEAHCTWDERDRRGVPLEWDWANWKVEAIPLEICMHFIMTRTSLPVPTL